MKPRFQPIHPIALVFTLALAWSAMAEDKGWINLLEGDSLKHWTRTGGQKVEQGWHVHDGVLHRDGRGGNIITAADYGDFELQLDWKVSPGANSGIKDRVRQYGRSWLGLEYQVLDDDRHPDAKPREGRRRAGAVYDLFACNDTKRLKPVGEWNRTRIVVVGHKVEHWLNGTIVVKYAINGSDWKREYPKSKFARTKDFAQNLQGRILLQDHGDEVWYRNIRIRPVNVAAKK